MTEEATKAEEIVPATIDLAANAANEVRNLPPGAPTVYVNAHGIYAAPDGRLYIRGDYEWWPGSAVGATVPIRRLPDTRLVIESIPGRVPEQDPKHCFERWHGEYLFQVVETAATAET